MRTDEYRRAIDRQQSEADFQRQVITLAESLRWSCYHTHDSQRSNPGYPDLTLWRERIVYAELKRENGKLSHAQMKVLDELKTARGEVYVWRPSDWANIEEILTCRK